LSKICIIYTLIHYLNKAQLMQAVI